MIAYIPARSNSSRIKKKNIRQLGDKPIIAHTIQSLQQSEIIDKVCVSTDSHEFKEIAESYGAITLDLRKKELSDSQTGFMELINHDIWRYVNFLEEDPTCILFVLATAALVPSNIYERGYKLFKEKRPELLMSAAEYRYSPYFAMKENSSGYWSVLFEKESTFNTQNLPKTLVDAGLFYFLNLYEMSKYEEIKHVKRLLPMCIEEKYCVDVDCEKDWKIIEENYRSLRNADA